MKPFEQVYQIDYVTSISVKAINSYPGGSKWVVKVMRRGEGVNAVTFFDLFAEAAMQRWIMDKIIVYTDADPAISVDIREDVRRFIGLTSSRSLKPN